MPVRSLTSSVFKWPEAKEVVQAVRRWAGKSVAEHPEVVRIGYFGSYARGEAGVGSDLDLLLVVDRSDQSFERRAADWDVTELPVPTEVLVYTREEWNSLDPRGRFCLTLMKEAVWIFDRLTS